MKKQMKCSIWELRLWHCRWRKKWGLSKVMMGCHLGLWTSCQQYLVEHLYFHYSYKAKGANAIDPTGKPDSSEFLNVAKDDAIAWPQQARRSYPSTVNARMESTITPFVRKSLEVNTTLFQIFEEKLGLPAGAITERHKLEEFSGSEARLIRTSPSPSGKEPVVGIGAHSDFGSLVCTLTPIG